MGSTSLAAAHPPARPPARTVTTIPLQPGGLRGKKSVRCKQSMSGAPCVIFTHLSYTKLKGGAVRWGTLDLPALELSIMSRASLLVNKSGLCGQGKGASFREPSWGGTGSQQPRAAAE